MSPRLTLLLFFTILIEGYVVLSSELIAIRQTMPFVGSGTETVAIIISAVLLPLAFGYYIGGKAYNKNTFSIRKRLVRNITIATLFLTIGLSYLLIEGFFNLLNAANITHRIAQIILYATTFLVVPTFLLGQTVPLITNYFRRHRNAEIAGRILFFSTTGSFGGAIVSTLVLMPWVGVGYTVIANSALLAILALLLSPKRSIVRTVPSLMVLLLTLSLNNHTALQKNGIVRDNEYNTIRIHDIPEQHARIMELNRTGASKYADNDEFLFPYVYYLERTFIEPLSENPDTIKDILVIGAGGFTLGLDDGINQYTFVDIDDDLLEISEEQLLQQPLTDNKVFYPEPARGFLERDSTTYDLIILDVYTNIHSVPPQLMTVEFLTELRDRLKPRGVLAANIVTTPNFEERFSVLFDNTFRSVFPHYNRQVIQDYNPWNTNDGLYQNIIYSTINRTTTSKATYTDNKNTLAYDRAF